MDGWVFYSFLESKIQQNWSSRLPQTQIRGSPQTQFRGLPQPQFRGADPILQSFVHQII